MFHFDVILQVEPFPFPNFFDKKCHKIWLIELEKSTLFSAQKSKKASEFPQSNRDKITKKLLTKSLNQNVTILSIDLIYFQNYFHQEALFLKCTFLVTDAFRTDFFENNLPDHVCSIQAGHVTVQKMKIITKTRKARIKIKVYKKSLNSFDV